ncbi:hypothetical protein GGS21DRAFT_522918 [Xylaria nigripes]|nr:hypothetical protein GGS21DRAFT_522918 [Xylaria nigripes]
MRFALHPQAKFDPIPPDLDLHRLVDQTPNFDWVTRISVAQIRRLGSPGFEKLVQLHVIEGGRPLVIEGWDRALPKDLFSATWLEKTCNKKQENVRDITAQSDIPMTTGHYLRSMKLLTNQWTPANFRDERRQRLYLKDIDCPDEWFEHLKKIMPPNVFYMNENVSENTSHAPRADEDIFGAPEKTPAIAGDLMSSLDHDMRAQNLMCYVGHEGTYTPAHREMCASLGQNIMVEASGDENGEKPGSSIWFMTETKDREVVREYFLSMLGHDIEIERHFAQINAWKRANFPVYIVEQRVGDFILVPPLAPHQVWNRGTRTMKVAWNRTTVETIELALHEALPKARLVCRDEQYKNKAIIYFTLQKYYQELRSLEDGAESNWLGLGQELAQNSVRLKQMARDFKKLFGLFTEVLVDEMFGEKQPDVEYIPFDSNITCSYCRSNIFNRFLTCKSCVRELVNGDEDTYDVCMECYVMGRSCICISGLQWCEQWKWSELVDKHETWRAMVIEQDGFVDINSSPQPVELARRITGKKSVAQICQEQLRRRPWNDIAKPPEKDSEDISESDIDDDGHLKKRRQTKRRHQRERKKIKNGAVRNCHVCSHRDLDYKLAVCSVCNQAYCYGVLWRAFDMLPQSVMEQEHWLCPKCLKICNCGGCRQAGNTVPYIPKNTLLGHDTRPIADDRSVESIVDFRLSNINWLKVAGEGNRSKESGLLNRLRQQADAEKAKDPLASLDADGAAHDIDMDRFADQSSAGQEPGANPPVSHGESGPRAETATMTGLRDTEDDSVYPDPSGSLDATMLDRGRMMGMGFYDQDESTDRILFDPFQMPTAEALKNEFQISDYVKKTLRLAKRKARLEQHDDPDFKGPTTQRKRPKTGNIEQLINLDPALLSALNDNSVTPNRESGLNHSVALHVPSSTERPGGASTPSAQPESAQAPSPEDQLRLSLRHAKPRASYVEDTLEDADEAPVSPITIDDIELGREPESEPPAVDLAADAIRSFTGTHTTQQELPDAQSTPQHTGKKRGRPPRSSLATSSSPTVPESKRRGRLPRSSTAKDSVPAATEPKRRMRTARSSLLTNASPATQPKGRGRLTRNSRAADSEPDASEPDAMELDAMEPVTMEPVAMEPDAIEPDAIEPDAMELNATEPDATELDGMEPDAPEPAFTESAATQANQREESAESSVDADPLPATTELKQRGRPLNSRVVDAEPEKRERPRPSLAMSPSESRRSRRGAAPSAEAKPALGPIKNMESMSLKERLALKGKKNIRIRGRIDSRTGSSRNSTATPTSVQSPKISAADVDAKERRRIVRSDPTEVNDDNSELPSSNLRKRDGPTIVKFDSYSEESSSSDSGANSDDDIPAKTSHPARGKGRWATRNRV